MAQTHTQSVYTYLELHTTCKSLKCQLLFKLVFTQIIGGVVVIHIVMYSGIWAQVTQSPLGSQVLLLDFPPIPPWIGSNQGLGRHRNSRHSPLWESPVLGACDCRSCWRMPVVSGGCLSWCVEPQHLIKLRCLHYLAHECGCSSQVLANPPYPWEPMASQMHCHGNCACRLSFLHFHLFGILQYLWLCACYMFVMMLSCHCHVFV